MIMLCSGADELFERGSETSDDMTVLRLQGRLDFRMLDAHKQAFLASPTRTVTIMFALLHQQHRALSVIE